MGVVLGKGSETTGPLIADFPLAVLGGLGGVWVPSGFVITDTYAHVQDPAGNL